MEDQQKSHSLQCQSIEKSECLPRFGSAHPDISIDGMIKQNEHQAGIPVQILSRQTIGKSLYCLPRSSKQRDLVPKTRMIYFPVVQLQSKSIELLRCLEDPSYPIIYVSGQITIIPKPDLRGFWKDSLTKPPFGVTSAEVTTICPDVSIYIYTILFKELVSSL